VVHSLQLIRLSDKNDINIWRKLKDFVCGEIVGTNKRLTSLLLPILVLCTFIGFTVTAFFSTLLVDIASSFKVSIGTASQLVLISSITGLVVGIAMSAISIKFKHRSLFLVGILVFTIGTIVFFLAHSFVILVLSQFLVSVGSTTIFIMSYALIGEQLLLNKRGWAIGLTVSGGMAAFIIVAPLSGLIASIAGWRSVLSWFVIPASMICVVLSFLCIPSNQPKLDSSSKSIYMQAYKRIFLCKSTVACLVGTTLVSFIGVVPIYAVSFYRTNILVSPTMGGVFSSIAATGAAIGGIVGGKLVNRFGRKSLAVTLNFVSGIACIVFTFIPIIGISVAIWTLAAATAGLGMAGLTNLTLEQVPTFRASMMSINGSFQYVGVALGAIIGGLVLNCFHNNFQLLMTILGSLGASAAIVLFLFTKDPCKIEVSASL
jgi:DHA1 family inner membrane transport protein